MSDFVGQIRGAAHDELHRLAKEYSAFTASRFQDGVKAILDLHKPNESGNGCVVCARADASCGCVSAADDSWPCQTVLALGAMFGVEYVPPLAPEPQEPDLDVLRAALEPDDDFGRDLLDFERFPELVVNGCPLTREMRIDGASFRPVWQRVMRAWPRVVEEELFRSQLLVGAPAMLRPRKDTVEVSMQEPGFGDDRVTMKIAFWPW